MSLHIFTQGPEKQIYPLACNPSSFILKNNKWDRSIFQDKSPGYDVAKQMTHFSQSIFIFYDSEEELQKACVLLAEECRPLGSTVH